MTRRQTAFSRVAPCLIIVLFGCVGIMLAANFMLIGAWLVYDSNDTEMAVAATPTAVENGLSALQEVPTPAGVVPTSVANAGDQTDLDLTALTALTATTATPTLSPATDSSEATLPLRYDLPVPPDIDQRPIPVDGRDRLSRLLALSPPPRDYHAVDIRLGAAKPRPRTLSPATVYEVGDQRSFYTVNGPISATVAAVGTYAYFWMEEGLAYDADDLTAVVARFDQEIYPHVTSRFGTEWNPGIDGDPRLNVMHLTQFESDELGYFDSADEYPRTVFPESNEQEVLYLNLGDLRLDDALYYGTLTHELQHLTQWHQDPNEMVWLNEGLSQLAEHTAGFNSFGVSDYLNQPALPLTEWNEADVYGHYAASALFSIYFYEQLGDTAVYDLAHHPANGMASVAAVLAVHRPDLTLEQFMSDWAVANFLDHGGWGRQYDYEYDFRLPRHDQRVTSVPFTEVRELPQYGVRYIELPAGEYQLSFAGDTWVPLTDAPLTGQQVWLAPAVDDTEAHLTTRLDLRQVAGQVTLTFDTWVDLEEAYDFAFVMASADGGTTWRVLDPEMEGDTAVAISYYGPALTGQSDGWQSVRVPLDAYAGQEILLRFAMLSDGGVSERGWALDNIAVPEIGFSDPVEVGTGTWQAEGFAALNPAVPQQWSVQLITYEGNSGGVEALPLDGRNQGQWQLTLNDSATLVVMPQTPLTKDTAVYWLSLEG